LDSYFKKQYKNLKYVKASESLPGLRNAQIGAIHAISSYFTLPRSKAAIVVMPTGSGKTAVLMMSPYVLEGKKALVVTPSVMVRGQIFEDFASLRTLCKATVLNNSVKKPNIFEMKNMYSEDHYKSVCNADVVVARGYKPNPTRRVYIPKDGSNKKRPLGNPAMRINWWKTQ